MRICFGWENCNAKLLLLLASQKYFLTFFFTVDYIVLHAATHTIKLPLKKYYILLFRFWKKFGHVRSWYQCIMPFRPIQNYISF